MADQNNQTKPEPDAFSPFNAPDMTDAEKQKFLEHFKEYESFLFPPDWIGMVEETEKTDNITK